MTVERIQLPVALVLMGVTGSGKTTVGGILSQRLGWPFLDGDDFHPPENVEKMAVGTPLTDEDRLPWLQTLAEELNQRLECGDSCLLACSALRASYREVLIKTREKGIQFVHLQGSPDLIGARLQERVHRYMPASLLCSQFDTLETPENALAIGIDETPEKIADQIIAKLGLWS